MTEQEMGEIDRLCQLNAEQQVVIVKLRRDIEKLQGKGPKTEGSARTWKMRFKKMELEVEFLKEQLRECGARPCTNVACGCDGYHRWEVS